MDLNAATSWDIAVRYHEFKAKPALKNLAKHLRKLSAQAILERARQILGAVVHPVDLKSVPLRELPSGAVQVDFDLDEILKKPLWR